MNKFGGASSNFPEAYQNAIECYKTDALPANVANLFDKVTSDQTSFFWLCVAALKQFYELENRLPVSGALPDMVSTTDFYLGLQTIYIKQAQIDKEKMAELVSQIRAQRGL